MTTPQANNTQTSTSLQLPAQAVTALNAGRKIDAIKIVHTQTGLGLKASKELVEAYAQQHQSSPPNTARTAVGITAPKSRHSVTVGILVLLLVVFMLGLIFF